MGTPDRSQRLQPFRVVRDGKIIGDHPNSGQAIDQARQDGAQSVYYLNSRDFGATVWHEDWATTPIKHSDDPGYL